MSPKHNTECRTRRHQAKHCLDAFVRVAFNRKPTSSDHDSNNYPKRLKAACLQGSNIKWQFSNTTLVLLKNETPIPFSLLKRCFCVTSYHAWTCLRSASVQYLSSRSAFLHYSLTSLASHQTFPSPVLHPTIQASFPPKASPMTKKKKKQGGGGATLSEPYFTPFSWWPLWVSPKQNQQFSRT